MPAGLTQANLARSLDKVTKAIDACNDALENAASHLQSAAGQLRTIKVPNGITASHKITLKNVPYWDSDGNFQTGDVEIPISLGLSQPQTSVFESVANFLDDSLGALTTDIETATNTLESEFDALRPRLYNRGVDLIRKGGALKDLASGIAALD